MPDHSARKRGHWGPNLKLPAPLFLPVNTSPPDGLTAKMYVGASGRGQAGARAGRNTSIDRKGSLFLKEPIPMGPLTNAPFIYLLFLWLLFT